MSVVFGLLLVAIMVVLGIVVYALLPRNSFATEVAAIDASVNKFTEDESSLLRRLLDEGGRRDQLESRLQQAGWYEVTPAMLVTRALIYGAVGFGLAVAILIFTHRAQPMMFALVAMVTIFAANMPYSQLKTAAENRVKEVHRTLPDFLDLLSTTVEAGIALNGAINVAAEGLHGPLGEELRAAMSDVRLGRSRAEALTAMSQRLREPDLTTVVTALVQSERLGANVSEMLAQLSAESRERRIMRAEELAAQLSNKLVFPMALCMLPALLIMIFGGVIARFFQHF